MLRNYNLPSTIDFPPSIRKNKIFSLRQSNIPNKPKSQEEQFYLLNNPKKVNLKPALSMILHFLTKLEKRKNYDWKTKNYQIRSISFKIN